MYIARPYNFNLSPLLEEKLNIEREFTFHTACKLSSALNGVTLVLTPFQATSFLTIHNFSFDKCLREGVVYLSRQEEALCRQRALAREDKRNLEDITFEERDIHMLGFIERVRQDITDWQDKPLVRCLNTPRMTHTDACAYIDAHPLSGDHTFKLSNGPTQLTPS